MPEPIKIVVVAQTEDAAQKLKDFVSQSGSGMEAGMKKSAAAAEELNKSAFKARMGLLELEHVGRSSVDIMLMGGNSRMLLAQIPQLVQSLSLMGITFGAMLPYVAGVTAAVGSGYLGWQLYMSGVEDTTQKIQDMVAALDKVPAVLEKIATLQKAGVLSPEAAAQYADYLNLKKPLYVGPDGKITTEATHEESIQKSVQGGMVAFDVVSGSRQVPNRVAGREDTAAIVDWIKNRFSNISENQAKSAAALRDEMDKTATDLLLGVDREVADTRKKFEDERQKLALLMQQSGNTIGPNYDASVAQRIAQLKVAEENAVQDLLAKEQQKRAQEQFASERELRTQEAERTRNSLQEVEDKITAMSQQEGVKRGQFAAVEYSMRLNALQRAYYAGDLGEQEYTHQVIEASKKRAISEADYRNELSKVQQLKEEISTAELEGKINAIESDPFKNIFQKSQELQPLYSDLISKKSESVGELNQQYDSSTDEAARLQIKEKIAAATRDQIELEQRLKNAVSQGSWQGAYTKNLIQLQNLWQNFSVSLTNGAFQLIQQGVNGMASALTNVIMGTQSAAAAFSQFAMTALTSFIEMVIETILYAKLAIPVLTFLGVLSGGTTAASGSAITILSLGSAMSFVAGMAGFAEGGLVSGPGTSTSDSIPAMLSNGEFVVRAAAAHQFGLENLHAINAGDFSFVAPDMQRIGSDALNANHQNALGGKSAGAGAGMNLKTSAHVILVNDRSEMMNALKSSQAEEVIVAAVRKNRLKIGIQT